MECFSKIEMRFSLTQAKSFELKLINSRFMRSPSLMPSTKNLKNRYPIGIYLIQHPETCVKGEGCMCSET